MGLFDFFGPPTADQQQGGGGVLGGMQAPQPQYQLNEQGIGDYLRANQQSLMGLGLGMMSGNRGMGDALAGYQAGARGDMLANAQLEKRKQEQNQRAAALAIAKAKGWNPAQTAMAMANPDMVTHILQAELTPEKQSQTDKIIASLPADQRQEYINRQILGRGEAKGPQWAEIKRDEFGNPIHGWVSSSDQTVRPYGEDSAPVGQVPAPAAGLSPMRPGAPQQPLGASPAPPGVDPKEWRKNETERLSRMQTAQKLGMKPDDPGTKAFIATGKMPREDAQPLTATDKKAILEADEHVSTTQGVIDNLKAAKQLSPKAYGGPTAGIRGDVMSNLGSEAGIATKDLHNLITTNALSQLRSIFGGNPTEGERGILLEIQGSVNQPDAVRQKIYDRAITMAERRLSMNQQRANELRGQTFYKQGGGQSSNGGNETAPAAPVRPSKRLVYNPTTGALE